MNNKEFIATLSNQTDYSQEETQQLVKTVLAGMVNTFDTGDSLLISGFGTFEVKKRVERAMVNPATGQKMLIPPKLVLGFRPAASIKERLRYGGNE